MFFFPFFLFLPRYEYSYSYPGKIFTQKIPQKSMDINKLKSMELGYISNISMYHMGCKQKRKISLIKKGKPLDKIKSS